MADRAMTLTAEASYAARYLKRMARGRLIFLRSEITDIELTRKSARDYLTAMDERPVTVTLDSERLLIS